MSRRTNRRQFIQQSTATGLGFWVAGGTALAESKAANEKLNFACIGVGGKGSSDVDGVARLGNIVALCDVDDHSLEGKARNFPNAAKYNDFRKMFDEMGSKIDAVTVSTADHAHAPASMMAIKNKKHVYCQKPLTHTVHEARQLRLEAKKNGVCTQMGNQGTAENGLRRAVEIIQAGILGQVKEVHVWTNRPIWPQGNDALMAIPYVRDAAMAALMGKASAAPNMPIAPSHVHWDLFLGPAPERPYTPGIHPFAWRGWWDFGTGALGDMACHTANMAFMALKLGHPTSVEPKTVGPINSQTYPTWAHIISHFPARGDMAPVVFNWYEGARKEGRVLPPLALLTKVLKHGEKLSDSGSLLVGDKGILFSPNDYGASYRLIGNSGESLDDAAKSVPQTLPRNGKGDNGMKEEWVQAIKAGKPEIAMSNFDYAAMLTETILLGNVAMRVGKKFDWDGPDFKITSDSSANQYLHYEYRKGWTL
jgi:predicted dehydrogenase